MTLVIRTVRLTCMLSLLAVYLFAFGGCSDNSIPLPADWPIKEVKPPRGSIAKQVPDFALPVGQEPSGHYNVQDGQLETGTSYREWLVCFTHENSLQQLVQHFENILLPKGFKRDPEDVSDKSETWLSSDEVFWVALISVDDMYLLLITEYESSAAGAQ